MLFLFPACLVLTAAGPEALGRLAGTRGRRIATVATVACAALALFGLLRNLPPYAPEPLKPVLEAMRQAWQPGDRVYVYYGGEKAFLYYARRYGFAAADYVLGRCAREDPRLYLRELDRFRGAPRVWLVVTHAVPEETTPSRATSSASGSGGPRSRREWARRAPKRPRARRPLRPLGRRSAGLRHGGHLRAAPSGRRRHGRRVVLPSRA